MGAVLRFIAWVLGKAWRYGLGTVRKVAAWAKANWRTVERWIERGLGFATIVEMIIRILGL